MNAPEKYFENLSRATAATKQEPNLLYGIDPIAYARFVHQSQEVKTTNDFICMINTAVHPILPHEMFLAGIGYVRRQEVIVQDAIGINYPRLYLDKLVRRPVPAGPILSSWLRTGEPQFFDVDAPPFAVADQWLAACRRNGLRNIASHGVRDLSGATASYFTFARLHSSAAVSGREILETVIPVLHQALTRVWRNRCPSGSVRGSPRGLHLTEKERLILALLVDGRTNLEIAHAMARSRHTVRNQVSALFAKLGVTNRARAVAAANALGLHLKL